MKAGDILFGAFPTEEGGKMLHPMLVLHVDENLNGRSFRAAYGSSRKVSESGAAKGEFALLEIDKGFQASGLVKSTRFNLRITTNIPENCFQGRRIGYLDLNDVKLIQRLKKAMMEV